MKMCARYNQAAARWGAILLVQFWLGPIAYGTSLQLVSAPDPAAVPSAGGGGDSYLPVVSRDGRYVLFGSTAGNLVAPGTNRPGPALLPVPINVFLRDRTNGATVLVSVNSEGTGGGDGDSLPVGISTNGRYALFESRAGNLVPGDTNHVADVFLRDLAAGTTLLVSAGTNGACGDGASYSSVMTPDGRYVAFASVADNLVPGDTNGIPDVFVRDMTSNRTEVVSAGAQAITSYYVNQGSDTPVITPDGRYIAFYSTATNFVPGVGTMADVYVRDRLTGTITWASAGALPSLQSLAIVSDALSFNYALSDDGRFVAFEAAGFAGFASTPSPAVILRFDTQTSQTELVDTNAAVPRTSTYENVHDLSLTPDGRFIAYVANAHDNPDATTVIRVWDAQTGVSTLASGDTNNSVAAGSVSDSPVLDDTGRFVAFVSGAPDPATNAGPTSFHVYRRDLQSQATALVDADTNTAGSLLDPGMTPAMSGDARVIVFQRQNGAASPLNSKQAYDVLARDFANNSIQLISTHDPALASLTPQGSSVISSSSVSSNAQFIAFWSEADDVVGNDTNGLRDVFVRDARNGTNVLVSVNTNGVSGDGYSTDSAISADGRYIAFTSLADDLVKGDTNRATDVFVRDLLAGTTALVSVNASGTGPGNAGSYLPLISEDGRVLVFHSQANNLQLGLGVRNDIDNLFWRDLSSNRTYALTTNQSANKVSAVSMTPGGRVVALATGSSSIFTAPTSQLYLWDSASASIVYSLNGGSDAFGPLALSPDGNRLVYATNAGGTSQLVALDRTLNTNWVIASYPGTAVSPPRFSADSRFLAYVGSLAPSSTYQVFLYDFQTGTNLLVTRGYDGASPGDNDSDSPDVSSDGRFVSYRSAASDLVPGDTNTMSNIFLYDRSIGATTLVTASRLGRGVADNPSLAPVFSGDGRTLIFGSWAGDLIPGDYNQNSDVFALGLYDGTPMTCFAISVAPSMDSAPSNWLSWPVIPGKAYRVQFKLKLDDPSWQDLNGQISIMGGQGYLKDAAPATAQRFYRVEAF